jgi:hypothetical protein
MSLPRVAAVTLAAALSLTGCSLVHGSEPPSRLQLALRRIADGDSTKAFVEFGDTAALVAVSGRGDTGDSDPWYAVRTFGAAGVPPESATLGGMRPFDADYMIAAGNPRTPVALVAGGQDAAAVTTALTAKGWTSPGDGQLQAPGGAGELAVWLGRVRASGPDVVYGGAGAALDTIGAPSGRTLADDPWYAALAGCLGGVIAAELQPDAGGSRPTAVAVGIYRPADANATVRAAVCTSWSSAEAARNYRQALPGVLSSGESSLAGPFTGAYTSTEITDVGGDQHVVRLRADTGQWRDLVFQALRGGELPGLRGV